MEQDFVGMIRGRSEEEDLDQILRSAMGGYTKKSVRDYLQQLKRQQQEMQDTFAQNLQTLLAEKEDLQNQLAMTRTRMEQAERDYSALASTVETCRSAEVADDGTADTAALRNTLAILEKDMDEAVERINSDALELEKRERAIAERDSRLKQAAQETALLKEKLALSQTESTERSRVIARQTAELQQLQTENAYLKSSLTDGKVSELQQRVDELVEHSELERETLAQQAELLRTAEQRAATMEEQLADARKAIGGLQASVEEQTLANEKLAAANGMLADELAAERQKNLELLCQRTELRVEKAALARKLDAAALRVQLADLADGETI